MFQGSVGTFLDYRLELLQLYPDQRLSRNIHVRSGQNPHCFPVVGDKVINLIVGVYIPIIRWDDHPQYNELIDPGTHGQDELLDSFTPPKSNSSLKNGEKVIGSL